MRLPHLFLVIAVTAIWGFNFVAVRWAVDGFPPILTNGIRFLLVAIVLSPFLRIVPGQMPRIIAIAFCLGFLHFGLVHLGMAFSETMAPVVVASQMNVPFATLLAVLLLGERIGIWRILGLSLSFTGVTIISFDPAVFGQLTGTLVILASALAYGLVAILMRGLKSVPPMTVQAWVAIAAIAASWPLSLGTESGQIDALAAAPLIAWIGVLYSAVGSTIIGHGSMTWLLQQYPVTTVTPYLLLMPVFAQLSAILVLDDWPTPLGWLGLGLALSGVAIITFRTRAKVQKNA